MAFAMLTSLGDGRSDDSLTSPGGGDHESRVMLGHAVPLDGVAEAVAGGLPDSRREYPELRAQGVLHLVVPGEDA